jgi:hypothetical protein
MANTQIDLSTLSQEALLNVRLCDLPLTIEKTWLAHCVKGLYRELESKGIHFKPVCYLADEWLTPDQEPVIGIPFFLAHPLLIRLEKKMMLDVEGGTREWCMKLLRHEAGHALNYAYTLYRRKKWQDVFGQFSLDYGDTYRFRPYSRAFVRHLEDYYAQYHPDEDFAETFAVWLTPGSDWESLYKGWGALKKLKYVDTLMHEVKEKPPRVPAGKKYWHIASMKTTLKTYYQKKRRFYAEEFPDFHDTNLKKIFVSGEKKRNLMFAAELIKKYQNDILGDVSTWTGEKRYIINRLLETIMDRCKELRLRVPQGAEVTSVLKVSVYLTTLIMNYTHTGRFAKKK